MYLLKPSCSLIKFWRAPPHVLKTYGKPCREGWTGRKTYFYKIRKDCWLFSDDKLMLSKDLLQMTKTEQWRYNWLAKPNFWFTIRESRICKSNSIEWYKPTWNFTTNHFKSLSWTRTYKVVIFPSSLLFSVWCPLKGHTYLKKLS